MMDTAVEEKQKKKKDLHGSVGNVGTHGVSQECGFVVVVGAEHDAPLIQNRIGRLKRPSQTVKGRINKNVRRESDNSISRRQMKLK